MPQEKRFIEVEGERMAYVEEGKGASVFLFLHGNPTSSYLWRRVMPPIAQFARCLAPDLIGMGDSAKLSSPGPATYRFLTHRRFLWGFIEQAIGSQAPVVLVVHDWGSALGFDWANHHRERARGVAYMEAIVRPLAWAEWPAASRRVFQGFRSERGEEMILQRNLFVERVLPGSILRRLEPEEMAEYRRPFAAPADRWPTLAWPREIPIDGEPADVTALVADYAAWMAENDMPKLFVNAEPGAILVGAQREFCRLWRHQSEVTLPGIHFIQEDRGAEIGAAIARWAKEEKLL
jgi:haloalkane dehalogenase